MPLFDASFFGKPGVNELLMQSGLGLLAAGQPMPHGANRFAPAMQGLQAGLTSRNQAMQLEQMEQFRKAQMAQMEAAAEEAQRKQTAQSRVANYMRGMGGPGSATPGPRADMGGGVTGQAGGPGLFGDANFAAMLAEGGDMASALKLMAPQEQQKPFSVAPGSRVFDPVSRREIYAAPEKPEENYGGMAFDNAMNMWYQTGPKGKRDYVRPPTGMSFTSDGKGGVTLTQGPGVSGGIGNPTKTDLEKGIGDMSDILASTQSIRQDYQRKHLTLGGKLANMWTSLKSKAGADIDPQSRQELEDFAIFRASTGKNFADQIKAMSGAAVTESEGKRQEIYLPTAGTGIFDGDDPDTFESKLNRQESFVTSAMVRKRAMIDSGMSLDAASRKAPLYAENKENGRRLWLHEFVDGMKKANPGASIADIMDAWSKNYSGR